MGHSCIVAHYQEVGLKGRNRSFFERVLIENIKRATGLGSRVMAGRIVTERPDDMASALDALGRVFGISSLAPALEIPAEEESIVQSALEMARESEFDSFAVRARKGHSSYEGSSQSLNELVGGMIKDSLGKRVDLSNPDWTCHIELVLNRAFLFWDRRPGPGGLPVGSSGRLLALLSGGIDSPVAAWMMAKRGAPVDYVHFHGQPFADPSSVRQATRLADKLGEWIGKRRLWSIPFGDIQSEIVTGTPQELRVVLYRRFMMRIAEALALREGIAGLITGESLGQVASQTLPNIVSTNEVVLSLPVLRPLIGMDKLEIEALAKRIGSYEISIQPHQDCCVLFIPRKVTTAAKAKQVQEAESNLNIEGLVKQGLEGADLLD